MTHDLRPLLSDEGTSSEAQRLLRAGAAVSPPGGARDAIWSSLAAQLPPAAGAPPVADAGASAVASATGAGMVKAGLVGVALGLAVAGVGSWMAADAPRPPPSSAVLAAPPAAVAATPVTSAATLPSPRPEEAPTLPVEREHRAPSVASHQVETPRPSTTGAPEPAVPTMEAPAATPAQGDAPVVVDRRSQLQEESRQLRDARAALRQGNPARALQLLDAASRQFPRPVMGQEREALTVEALEASGAHATAAARARAFVARFPDSPHADRLRKVAGP